MCMLICRMTRNCILEENLILMLLTPAKLQHRKLCRTLLSLRKLTVCLWKYDMRVCPTYSSSSYFINVYILSTGHLLKNAPTPPHAVQYSTERGSVDCVLTAPTGLLFCL